MFPIALLPLETQGANTEQFSTKVDYDNTTTPEDFECHACTFILSTKIATEHEQEENYLCPM